MLGALARKIFGTANDRVVKSLQRTVDQINALEPTLVELSDDALRGRTQELRDRLAKGETLDDILPDRSEEHTSELQSLMRISYAAFCLQKKQQPTTHFTSTNDCNH